MSDTESTPPPLPSKEAKPSMSTGQKAFLRFSGFLAMVLFLLPTFYVVKYYTFDRPGEAAAVKAERAGAIAKTYELPATASATDLPVIADYAKRAQNPQDRIDAITQLGVVLGDMKNSFTHPIEALQAKSTLADIATHEPDPQVKVAAQDVIGRIAQGGAVLQR